MSKENTGRQQIVATSSKLDSLVSVLQIPVDEARLPVRSLATFCPEQPQDINPDVLYSQDSRNPQVKFRFNINKGLQGTVEETIVFSKLGTVQLFQKIQEIQDKLDLYI